MIVSFTGSVGTLRVSDAGDFDRRWMYSSYGWSLDRYIPTSVTFG